MIYIPRGTIAGATYVTAVDGAALLKMYFKGSNVTATFNNDPPVSQLTLHGVSGKASLFSQCVTQSESRIIISIPAAYTVLL